MKKSKISTRRGYGRKNLRHDKSNKNFNLSILGANANGIRCKVDSLDENINIFMPSIITLQETKVLRKGTINLKGYQVFEALRACNDGGGLLTAVDVSLNPHVITEDSEVLTIQIKANSHNIRVINAYGPQEDDEINKILEFWEQIENEIIEAKNNSCFILIQLDANAKIGSQYLRDDPHKTSSNGLIMLDMVKRQNMTIVNIMEQCTGVTTRERQTVGGIELSVLDYVIVCDRLTESVEYMFVDEERKYALTSYKKKRVKSDHNILFCKFLVKTPKPIKPTRKEVFILRENEGQKKFFEITSSTDYFSSIFLKDYSFPHSASILYKKLRDCIQKSFKKVRITTVSKPKRILNTTQVVLNQKRILESFLSRCKCPESRIKAETDINKLDINLTKLIAEKNAKTVKNHVESMVVNGNFSQIKLWKLKKKLCPATREPPMAKRDERGTMITAPELLKALYVRTYEDRLRCRKMRPGLEDILFLKNELWSNRLRELERKKTPDWKLEDLRNAIKSLKNNKAADPDGFINEIFKEGCIGDDLELALLSLFNGIKNTQILPKFMIKLNITTIFKNKGSRHDMKNERGIFILSSLRKILDKLIYLEKHDDIDSQMSDSNIGARKGRQVKDHLFLVHGIVNEVIKTKDRAIDIQIYDLKEAFDSLWLEDCLSDLYDSLSDPNKDEKIALLYKSSINNLVSVKTAHGLTQRKNINNLVQQGGTWGPLLCSNSIDKVGRNLLTDQTTGSDCYMYRNCVKILPLAMVDDLLVVSRCGIESLSLNVYVNTKIELKKLNFHVPDSNGLTKCHKLHIGMKTKTCPELKVHGCKMEEVLDDVYLGDVIMHNGRNTKNVQKRVSRGLGLISQVINLLESVSFGRHYIEIGLLLRESMFLSSMLYNVEVWYDISKAEVKEFERLDLILLRKILKVPNSTPKVALYLELGLVPINFLLKGRRIRYLHYLLSKETDGMLGKFFWAQWRNPVKGDWVTTVKDDMADLGFSDINEIKLLSKYRIKVTVKQRVKELALNHLQEKLLSSSKMKHLRYYQLELQDYFKHHHLSVDDMRGTFRFRVRMHSFGENYRRDNNDTLCPLCFSHIDSQDYLNECTTIKTNFKVDNSDHIKNIYSQHQSVNSIKLVLEMLKFRDKLLEGTTAT